MQTGRPKLRDSCDRCSFAKVRCTREKPVCGRCDKLDEPCYYSPARRIGRPAVSRRATSTTAHGLGLSRHRHSHHHQGHSSLQRQRTEEVTAHQCDSPLEALADHPWPSPSSPSPEPSLAAGLGLAAADFTNISDTICISPGVSAETLMELSPTPAVTPAPALVSSHWRSSSKSASNRDDVLLSAPQTDNPAGSDSDCVSRLLDTLLQQQSNTQEPAADGRDSQQRKSCQTTTAQTVPGMIIQVLMCPCSQRLDTALLIAAACQTVLDRAEEAATQQQRRQAPQNIGSGSSSSSSSSSHGDGHHFGGDVEFRQLSTLVLKFTLYYGGGGGGRSTGLDCSGDGAVEELLTCLAAELRARLNAMMRHAASSAMG